MKEPDYKSLAEKFPALGLTEDDVKAVMLADGARETAMQAIAKRQALIEELEQRKSDDTQQMYDLQARREELEAELKQNERDIRENRGRFNTSEYHITMAKRKIKSLCTDVRRREFKVFDTLVRRKLAAVGRSLRLRGGGGSSLKPFDNARVIETP